MSWTTSKYLYGLFWAIRNPGYGFDYSYGCKVEEGFTYSNNNPAGIDMIGTTLHEGTMLQQLTTGGTTYFKWGIVKKLTSAHYFRASFGWQLNPPLAVGQVRNLTMSISPWMKTDPNA